MYQKKSKVFEWWSRLSLAQCDQVTCVFEIGFFLCFILLCYVQIDLVGGTVAWDLHHKREILLP